MKILLVSLNRERMPAPVFPLGLAYIAGSLKKKGHHVEVMDLCFCRDVQTQLREILHRVQPEAIGLSLRNLDNLTYPGSVSYLNEAEDVIRLCRSSSTAPLIVGGSGFSLAPAALMRHLGVDFGIAGEGEEIFVRLVDSLEKREPVSPSKDLLVKGMLSAAPVAAARVSALSIPDRTHFETARYLEEGGMLNVQTKRGCPFSCLYCTYPLVDGREVRLRSVADVIEEIRQVHETPGRNYIYFVDDIFNYPASYARELCRAMAASRIPVRWTAFVNPAFLDGQLLGRMQEAGCAGIEFGTDSGSPRMLKNYRKAFNIDDIVRASELCFSTGMPHCHYLLFGGPGEDEESIEESFRLMDQLRPTAVIAMLGVRIYPGTELERLSIAEGTIPPDSDLIHPSFYISPLLEGRLEEIVGEKAMARNGWIVPGLEINITRNLMEAVRRLGARGPLWELVGRMKRPRVRPLCGAGKP